MHKVLRTVVIAIACTILTTAAALADGEPTTPPDPDYDPTEPYDGNMTTPTEAVLSDWGNVVSTISRLVSCILW
jgi:hypothetical protein